MAGEGDPQNTPIPTRKRAAWGLWLSAVGVGAAVGFVSGLWLPGQDAQALGLGVAIGIVSAVRPGWRGAVPKTVAQIVGMALIVLVVWRVLAALGL